MKQIENLEEALEVEALEVKRLLDQADRDREQIRLLTCEWQERRMSACEYRRIEELEKWIDAVQRIVAVRPTK